MKKIELITATPYLDAAIAAGHVRVEVSATHRVTYVIGTRDDGVEIDLASEETTLKARAQAERYIAECPNPEQW